MEVVIGISIGLVFAMFLFRQPKETKKQRVKSTYGSSIVKKEDLKLVQPYNPAVMSDEKMDYLRQSSKGFDAHIRQKQATVNALLAAEERGRQARAPSADELNEVRREIIRRGLKGPDGYLLNPRRLTNQQILAILELSKRR